MNRDELESVIWQQLQPLTIAGNAGANRDRVTAILAAADAYAAGDSAPVQAARREVLRRERTDIGGRQ